MAEQTIPLPFWSLPFVQMSDGTRVLLPAVMSTSPVLPDSGASA